MKDSPFCYAGYSLSDTRLLSSSGGFFDVLAKKIIETGGVVFGAAIDENGNVFHKSVEKVEELPCLYGSKYSQSKVGKAYFEVKKYLNDGRKVLFSGTPCQTAALAGIVGKNRENLILVDFVCHGVPNPEILRKYIQEVSEGKEVKSISFRDKKKGWLNYRVKITYKDGTEYSIDYRENEYMHGFIYNLYLRPSCFECRFKGIDRVTDFTLGDFWGVDVEEPEFYDSDGVSVILTHTERAERILGQIRDQMVLKKVDIKKVTRHNPSLIRSAERNKMEKLFYIDYSLRGVRKAINCIWRPRFINKIRNKLYRGIMKLIWK